MTACAPRTQKSKFSENLLEWAIDGKKDIGNETDKPVEKNAYDRRDMKAAQQTKPTVSWLNHR